MSGDGRQTSAVERLLIVLLFLLSATRFLIQKRMRRKRTDAERGDLVVRWNGQWLAWSLLICIAFAVFGIFLTTLPWALLLVVVVFLVPFWRCNEILIAFLFDAFDQMGSFDKTKEPLWRRVIRGNSGHTNLSRIQRVRLALRSYVEVVLNAGLIHFGLACLRPRLLPSQADSFYGGANISTVGDAIYFSAITITTVGYGDITPVHWSARSFVVYQIAIGLVLLYISVVVYLSGHHTSDHGVSR